MISSNVIYGIYDGGGFLDFKSQKKAPVFKKSFEIIRGKKNKTKNVQSNFLFNRTPKKGGKGNPKKDGVDM